LTFQSKDFIRTSVSIQDAFSRCEALAVVTPSVGVTPFGLCSGSRSRERCQGC
jgi:hypothetical protein